MTLINYIILLILILLLSNNVKLQAQVDIELPQKTYAFNDFDTNYIVSYRYHLNTRIYTSRKYTLFTLPTSDKKDVIFRPNGSLNLGVGWTYRGFTLNLGFPVPFLNGDFSERGKTSKLDMQMHMYARKSVIDVFLQRYQGYYNNEGVVPGIDGFYNDENLKVRKAGLSYLRLYNYRKYSLRTGAQHDEFQKISAGSAIYGFDVLYGHIRNDSNGIALASITGLNRYANINKIENFNIGPTLGYGYNFVVKRYLLVGAALTGTLAFTYYQENGGGVTPKENIEDGFYRGGQFGIAPQISGRAVVAYNRDKWGIFGYYVHHTMAARVHSGDLMSLSTGNYRLNIVYRFLPSNGTKKILKPYEWFFK